MRGQITLGRIVNIEIGLHYSWFLIAALLTMSLGGHLYSVNPQWPQTMVWAAAIVTALAFFVALLAHELSHAAVARARGVPVPSITLFALGGLARMDRDTADARTEFWMGLAGPVASVAIGIAALGLATLLGWRYEATPTTPGMVMLVWFGWTNLILAAFNMIPGFPLDGGRILRAIIWWISGKRDRATRIAAGLGQAVAFGFIAFGIFLPGSGIRWAVARLHRSVSLWGGERRGDRGGDRRVAAGCARRRREDCPTISRSTPVSEIAQEVLRTGKRCFFVVDDGHVAGLLTPREVRTVDRERWPSTPAGEAMRPLEQLHQIAAEAPVTEALDVLGREDVNQLPVVDHGRLRGVISRDQIVRLLSARAELTSM